MEVQIFGTRKSTDTRKALRFFAERRVMAHFVDLNERAASPAELRRFAQKFGVPALIDRGSKAFAARGLAHARQTDDQWLDKLSDEPLLLKVPLVRYQHQLSVGLDESTWLAWIER
jgi:arsenate reductase-like glutaredoxin family protein